MTAARKSVLLMPQNAQHWLSSTPSFLHPVPAPLCSALIGYPLYHRSCIQYPHHFAQHWLVIFYIIVPAPVLPPLCSALIFLYIIVPASSTSTSCWHIGIRDWKALSGEYTPRRQQATCFGEHLDCISGEGRDPSLAAVASLQLCCLLSESVQSLRLAFDWI